MKGSHVSRNAQRKIRSRKRLDQLSTAGLCQLIEQGQQLIAHYGPEKARKRNRPVIERAEQAAALLRRITG